MHTSVSVFFFRSRSHAARQKGIELPPDADDGLSDQDVDPELSNSSSEMVLDKWLFSLIARVIQILFFSLCFCLVKSHKYSYGRCR